MAAQNQIVHADDILARKQVGGQCHNLQATRQLGVRKLIQISSPRRVYLPAGEFFSTSFAGSSKTADNGSGLPKLGVPSAFQVNGCTRVVRPR